MTLTKIALCAFALVITPLSAAYAQACTPAALAEKPGALRASKFPGSSRGVSAADLGRARATLGKVHQMVAASYDPVGVVGEYSFMFISKEAADAFGYTLFLLRYNCDASTADPSDFYIGTDTPTSVKINANLINAFDLFAGEPNDNTFRGYMLMRNLPRKVDGFYYLGDNPGGNARDTNKAHTWLVTYGDELPFSVLTRKEYLLITKARLEKAIGESGGSTSFYGQYLDRVNQQLGRSDAELGLPAIVNATDEERFTGFLNEGQGAAARVAVKHNPAYYKRGLPKSAPQFFTVVYAYPEGEKVYVDNIEALKKAVDLNALRGMLGKP